MLLMLPLTVNGGRINLGYESRRRCQFVWQNLFMCDKEKSLCIKITDEEHVCVIVLKREATFHNFYSQRKSENIKTFIVMF